MNRLEKLMFTVGLIDKASGPASKIAAQFDNITNRATAGMAKIGVGAAGLFSTGYALKSLLGPSIEMDRALGEVRSLDVRESALKQLEKTALKTSIAIGGNAAEIVRSAYDIQSAIGGLADNELSRFTAAGSILAKGTKSDAATITDYMGTMYGIFQDTANKMGKAQWVEMLTGQTATAVKMFKTTGAEMAASFANLGAEANSHGIAMQEQMAIMGTLQATMSGSEAGTKYKAFLAGVGNAQKSLGLQFTDSQGRLLPMMEILDKLRGKFGDTFDVAESDALKKAFGSNEATGLIKLLMQDTAGLAGNIEKLSKIKGMDAATKMAQSMADPWERMDAAGKAVKTTFGRVLLPVLVPLLTTMTDGLGVVQGWAEEFPNITRVIGIATLGVFALVAAVSAFAVIGGIAQLASAGFGVVLAINTGLMKAYSVAIGIGRGALFLLNMAIWAGSGAMHAMKLALLTSLPAVWAFTAALLANPITWIVLGVVALIAGLVMLVKHWDSVTAAVGRFWEGLKKLFSSINPFEALGKGFDWLIAKINLIPGIDIKTNVAGVDKTGVGLDQSDSVRVGARDGGLNRQSNVPVGGLQQSISNNRGTTIEKMEVNTTGGVNGYQLQDELLMAGG